MTTVRFNLDEASAAEAPRFARLGDAGRDLLSIEHAVIPAEGWRLVSTGLKLAIPPWHVGLVCSRSGLAAKYGISVLNAPGVIDSGYRGEVKVILHNSGVLDYEVCPGDKIAQLLILKTEPVDFVLDPSIAEDETERGSGGFGSTGL